VRFFVIRRALFLSAIIVILKKKATTPSWKATLGSTAVAGARAGDFPF
jgi:hypothetical protein